MNLPREKLNDGQKSTSNATINPVSPTLIKLNATNISLKFSFALLVILTMHSAGQFIRLAYGFDYALGFVPLFYMYEEHNIPTWFSSITLFACSVLLVAITIAKKKILDPSYRYWLILCFVFLFLSIDEAAMIHEKIGHVTNRLLPHTLPSAWAIPYAFLAGILGVILVRLLLSIPPKYRILFCLSGALYVGGALGMEILEVMRVLDGSDGKDLFFTVLVTVEETLESGSILIFLYSLLLYIKDNIKEIRISVR